MSRVSHEEGMPLRLHQMGKFGGKDLELKIHPFTLENKNT